MATSVTMFRTACTNPSLAAQSAVSGLSGLHAVLRIESSEIVYAIMMNASKYAKNRNQRFGLSRCNLLSVVRLSYVPRIGDFTHRIKMESFVKAEDALYVTADGVTVYVGKHWFSQEDRF